MKILWINPHFLHPTNKGGQIRTLEMLRKLHLRHEIHYLALDNPGEPEGPAHSAEYSTRAYPVPHTAPPRKSLAFGLQLAGNLVSRLPLAVSRYASRKAHEMADELIRRERFDSIVCDFLFAAPNVPRLEDSVLFQHNVETTIWQRHEQNAADPLSKAFFAMQLRRMFAYEAEVCRKARYVVAVSDTDACRMREMFGIERTSAVPTGVDIEYFAPQPSAPVADLVFVGSMDWLPNIDGVHYFVEQILPLIRQRRPACTFAVVGRKPDQRTQRLGDSDPLIRITGTVPDIRPYLWGSAVAVVPLRIGGGTRLKIYEAMAAKIPVVSTTIGAEGLPVTSGSDCWLADRPEEFAERCITLLENEAARTVMCKGAWELVSSRFSWRHAADCFERILDENRAGRA